MTANKTTREKRQMFNHRGYALLAIGELAQIKTLTDMAGRRGTPESIDIAFQTIYDYLHGIANNDGNRV